MEQFTKAELYGKTLELQYELEQKDKQIKIAEQFKQQSIFNLKQ